MAVKYGDVIQGGEACPNCGLKLNKISMKSPNFMNDKSNSAYYSTSVDYSDRPFIN